MFRTIILFLIAATVVCGCAGKSPVSPGNDLQASVANMPGSDNPHRLWLEANIFINAAHDRVEVVPKREGRFHLNALKFLESYCKDCLKITDWKSNADGTVDLSVQITHPFMGYPEYTGFDVKGIIMFNGSYTIPGHVNYPPYPDPFVVSWRKLGDPQVLNADGFTLLWSPWYDSGSDKPVFNYWKGKYANGTPTASINAYLDYHTDETRHMFRDNGVVTRTYHLWLPTGVPIVAGYAVDACWEPPTIVPVTDPANDFPVTANQPEAYSFYLNVNNGETITDPDCCSDACDPSTGFYYSKQWEGHTALHFAYFISEEYHSHGAIWDCCGGGGPYGTCPGDWPDMYCSHGLFYAAAFPDGDYIGVAMNFKAVPNLTSELSYSVFEFTVDLN